MGDGNGTENVWEKATTSEDSYREELRPDATCKCMHDVCESESSANVNLRILFQVNVTRVISAEKPVS